MKKNEIPGVDTTPRSLIRFDVLAKKNQQSKYSSPDFKDEEEYKRLYTKGNVFDKITVKTMVCEAIDNIPDCAEIKACYVEHEFMDSKAVIHIEVAVKNETGENVVEFHNCAHEAFGTKMGFHS